MTAFCEHYFMPSTLLCISYHINSGIMAQGFANLFSVNHCLVPFLTDGVLGVQASFGNGHADFHENHRACQ